MKTVRFRFDHTFQGQSCYRSAEPEGQDDDLTGDYVLVKDAHAEIDRLHLLLRDCRGELANLRDAVYGTTEIYTMADDLMRRIDATIAGASDEDREPRL